MTQVGLQGWGAYQIGLYLCLPHFGGLLGRLHKQLKPILLEAREVNKYRVAQDSVQES